MNEEKWKFIDEAPLYLVSSEGRVRVEKSGKILVPNVTAKGYRRVVLCRQGQKVICRKIHRLVASAFCDGFQDGYTVNHINGDKSDNRSANLEWVPLAVNMQHGYNEGLLPTGDRHYNAKLTDEQADEILASRWSESAESLASRFAVSEWTANAIWSGEVRSRNLGMRINVPEIDGLPAKHRAVLASAWLFIDRLTDVDLLKKIAPILEYMARKIRAKADRHP